ncbi:MAG: pyridoxamine 5'-phosphate oxidase family protein [Bacteroidales bacterium]|jgi:uncharacterized protein YhbP (UPF0306 family)|nr:pyridoxamine 5'-phosphate oxidase family protein [Bacteroidales bacterium]
MKKKISPRIINFINDHHVLSLATANKGMPWTAQCFYVWMDEEYAFLFTSDDDTRHIKDALRTNFVAGSIVLETKSVGKIQGLQLQGQLEKVEGELYKKCKITYIKKYPIAILSKTALWLVRPTFFKMTDNRLGFGKKLYWGEER